MVPLRRVVAVTAGLIGTGAIAGALAGGIAFTFSLLVTPPLGVPSLAEFLQLFLFAGLFGAPLGAVTAPVLAWLLLRRVPLGQMFVMCAVGTMIGGVVGWFASMGGGNVAVNSLVGAFLGCLLTAIALRHRVARHHLT